MLKAENKGGKKDGDLMKLNNKTLKNLIKEVLDEMCGDIPSDPTHHHNDGCADDHEASMAKSDLYKAAKYAAELEHVIHDGEELEGWVQAKITKAADYLSSVKHYLEYEKMRGHE